MNSYENQNDQIEEDSLRSYLISIHYIDTQPNLTCTDNQSPNESNFSPKSILTNNIQYDSSSDDIFITYPFTPPPSTTTPNHSIDSSTSTSTSTSNNIPWYPILTHPISLTLYYMSWCILFLSYFILTELPSYLNNQYQFNIESAALLSILPFAIKFLFSIFYGQVFHKAEVSKTFLFN